MVGIPSFVAVTAPRVYVEWLSEEPLVFGSAPESPGRFFHGLPESSPATAPVGEMRTEKQKQGN